MELSVTNRETKDLLISELKKGKNEISNTKKITNSVRNESMVIPKTPSKSLSKRKETKIERKHDGIEKHRQSLKERQKKVHQFLDSDVANMLEQLLEKQLIQLTECKRLKQARKVNDHNY